MILFALYFACADPPDIPAEALLLIVTFAYLLLFVAFIMSFKVQSAGPTAATKPVGEKAEAASLTQSVTRSLKETAMVMMAAMERFLTIASGLDPYAGAETNEEQESEKEEENEHNDANEHEKGSLNEDWDSDDGDDAFYPIRSALGFFDGD